MLCIQTHEFIYGFFEGFTPYSIQGRLIRYELAFNILRLQILIIAAAEYIFDFDNMAEVLYLLKNIKAVFLLTFRDDEASAYIIFLHADFRYDNVISWFDFQHD